MLTAMVVEIAPMFAQATPAGIMGVILILGLVGLVVAGELAGARYISNNRVGVVEKLWSASGSIPEGGILAINGEAGFQSELLRGGFHFGYWRWQYRIHRAPLVTVSQGKIGYVYARDGEPLQPSQTLGRVVPCTNFQDARAFLTGKGGSPDTEPTLGQRGRQRALLREGVYAINLGAIPGHHRRARLSAGTDRPSASTRRSSAGRRSWAPSADSARWWSAA